MNNDQLIQIFSAILVFMVCILVILCIIFIYLKLKKDNPNKNKKKNLDSKTNEQVATNKGNTAKSYNKQSIFKFMDFDKIQDNMIVQKDGKRFLMVIECQGINYDLMSGLEKNSVEQGFLQFLNTLRYPIQIYVQTRSINLENSLQVYRSKLQEVQDKYDTMSKRYELMKDSGQYTREQLAKEYFELTKQANLCEYGNSVIQDTEKMSLNKNILNKNYYIIVPYLAAEIGNDKLDKQEIKGIAFSELYTRCQSIISSISVCGVRGKILRSNELVELLYMAYNRDEAETFGLDKAIKAGFNELYSTAPDVYEKKMKELDKIIEEKAMKKAQNAVNEAKSEIQQQVEEKENNMNSLIDEIAQMILDENELYIGKDVKELAEKKIEETKEGGNENGKKTGRKKKSTTIQ